MAFPVSYAVFCQLVAMEKSVAAESSVPLCVSISGPASCLLLLLQMERALPTSGWGGRPFLCEAWSCVSTPCRGGTSLTHAPAQQLCPACLPVVSPCGSHPVLGSARRVTTVARGHASPGRTRQHAVTPSLCVSLILASEFKGQGLFLFQSRWLLI